MSKIIINPAVIAQPLSQDRLAKFVGKPEDFTHEQYEMAKASALRNAVCLPQGQAESAFYFYYMGASWEEIASKFGASLGMLYHTAIYYDWYEKKKTVSSVRAGEKIKRTDAAVIDLVSDTLIATAAIYRTQLAEALKNPDKAKDCALIPKNLKDLQILLQMQQSLQTVEISSQQKSGPAVTVNIANVSGGQEGSRAYADVDYLTLTPAEVEENETERLEVLKVLERMRPKT